VSLLALGGLAFIFSLLFKMQDVITAIVTVRILIQFVSQAIGIIIWHYKKKSEPMPYKMPLFPVPAIVSIIIWLFILLCSKTIFIIGAIGIILVGITLYYIRNHYYRNQIHINN
jgi:amino acid transporter